MKPRAILWDLFGDHLRYLDDGRVPMRALTQLLDVFGVVESTSRVVLARMRREGWFTTYRDGRQTSYALTGRSIRMLDEGRARIFDRGRDDWDGTWRMVIYAVPEESRAERDQVAGRWPGTASGRWPRPPGSARTPGSILCAARSPTCPPPAWTCWKAGHSAAPRTARWRSAAGTWMASARTTSS